tara:strand:+ start:2226 stop:2414 length:189 start_codon:yes stop_codon:yes gene_type:complete
MKILKELREQLQEDIITVLSNSCYDYLDDLEQENSNRPSVKDRLTDELCQVICQTFLDDYGI